MFCGILLVMYLGVRCRRQAGRILGKSRTAAPGLPAGLIVLLNAFLGLGFVPSVHYPAPLFCRQVTCKENGECWDVLVSHTSDIEGKALGTSESSRDTVLWNQRSRTALRGEQRRSPLAIQSRVPIALAHSTEPLGVPVSHLTTHSTISPSVSKKDLLKMINLG